MSFAKRLSFLVKAGVPMYESLKIIRDQTKSKRQIEIFDALIKDVANGKSLSNSCAKFPFAFSEFAINIIKIGERSGTLSINLMYLSDELKKTAELKSKMIGSLIYPTVITLATLGITSLLIVYIFPKIMPIFISLKITLPLSTRIMLFASNFLLHYGILLMIFLVLFGLAVYLTIQFKENFHLKFDNLLLRLPIMSKLISTYNLAACTRTLGLLLKSGITLTEALSITAHTTANRVYRSHLHSLAMVVERGDRISAHLNNDARLFPDILCHMIAVGERSGSLSDSLVYLSQMYDAEVSEFTKNISSLIEPILMIFMGLLVGFVAVSVITPVYSITQHLPTR
jgi:type II secretory pathway component PulF